jgi:para-nitrobenzyl esterase
LTPQAGLEGHSKMKLSLTFILGITAVSISIAVPSYPVSTGSLITLGSPPRESVKLDSGLISGSTVGDVRVFKGIPFAQPPIGELRWKPPLRVKPWTGIRPCNDFGPSCPQPDILRRVYGAKLGKTGEDCLYLNVWTGARGPGEKRPVMVWLHGGGYTMGSGSTSFYNGEALARQGAVVVTINYRLGIYGFLAHPWLSKESVHNSSGNYGLLDQIAALQWVRRNIAAFGGDPGRVTIFGESAGAGSVCLLMASPLARELFHRAIAESGSAFGSNRHLREKWYGQEPAEKMGERAAAQLGAKSLPDLRSRSSESLLAISAAGAGTPAAPNTFVFVPIVDGWVVPDDPAVLFEEGKQAAVPLIVGTNADEGSIFLLESPIKTVEEYRSAARMQYGQYTDEVLKLYPAESSGEIRAAMNRNVTDSRFITGARMFAKWQSKVSRSYLYHFTWVGPGPRAQLGAYHASEIPHVFGTLSADQVAGQPAEKIPSAAMMGYWVRFAATGDPNGKGGVHWPAYQPASDQYIEFGTEIGVGSHLHQAGCDLFERVAGERRAKRRSNSAP